MILTIYTATTMIVLAYLLGSIPSAVWIGRKYYGIDIREHGSKNAGTTNMLRVLGRRAALPVFALDFLKGFVAVTVIELMQYDDLIGHNDIINLKIGAVFAAVLGHIFPVFAGFRGGKGVATLVGAVTGIYPPAALLCFGVWLVVLIISHYVSLSSMIAGCCFPVFTFISPKVNGSWTFCTFSVVIAVLLIVTHRKNIKRLWEGCESKIYIWRPRRVANPPENSDRAPKR
ncbi:MAG: glycerol-3-phosphate 1-O-acyltransferase PlsY [Alistipes sp.]|nr:glycerol-3-phosphate 1-O-acyltransferase PlsY [Alistipes sp.]